MKFGEKEFPCPDKTNLIFALCGKKTGSGGGHIPTRHHT